MANIKWAYTNANNFATCQRKFYFGNILANHHHTYPLRRKAFELKQMVNFDMWQGKVVDLVIEKQIIPTIKRKGKVNFEEIAEFAVDLAKSQFNFSIDKKYSEKGVKKTGNDFYQIIDIHELSEIPEPSKLQKVYDNVKKAILSFPKIQLPNNNMNLLDFLRLSSLLVPNVHNRSFTFEGIYISPQIDLLMYQDAKPIIIDWKLSESDFVDNSRQLVICGLTMYMNQLSKYESGKTNQHYYYEDIKLYEVNLLKPEVKKHEFTAEIAHEMLDYIFLSGKNIAFGKKEKKWNNYNLNNLEWAENDNACTLCNFRSLCHFLFKNKNQYDEKTYNQFIQNTKFI